MHLQPTHTPHSQHLQSDPHLEYDRKSVVELFSGNSLHVKAVGCFHTRALSLMFDGVVNAPLFEEKVSNTGVTQNTNTIR